MTGWSRRSRRRETTRGSRSSGTSAALLWWIRAQSAEAERAWRRAADEALQAGDERMLSDAVGWEASSMAVGPTPVDAAIVRCQEIRAILNGDPWAEALALQPLASLHAMRGEFSSAFELLDESLGDARRVRPDGGRRGLASGGVRGDAGGRSRARRAAAESRPARPGADGRAGGARVDRGLPRAVAARWPDATARRTGLRGAVRPRDGRRRLAPQVVWRQVRARVLARRGDAGGRVELAREAVEIAMTTDHLNIQADAMVDLAHRARGSRGREDAADRARDRRRASTRPRAMRVRAREARPACSRSVL